MTKEPEISKIPIISKKIKFLNKLKIAKNLKKEGLREAQMDHRIFGFSL